MFGPVAKSNYVDWINFEKSHVYLNSEADVLGWGCDIDDEKLMVLKKIEVRLIPSSECGSFIERSVHCTSPTSPFDIFLNVGNIFSDLLRP